MLILLVLLCTPYAADAACTGASPTWACSTASDLTGLLNATQTGLTQGDTINLVAGNTYSTSGGAFLLPNLGAGSSMTTLQTPSCPRAAGQRIVPSTDASGMAKLVTADGLSAVIEAAASANHWTLSCLHITTDMSNQAGTINRGNWFVGGNRAALYMHYIGTGSAATATVAAGVLTTDVTGVPADNLSLTLSNYSTYNALATDITASGKYLVWTTDGAGVWSTQDLGAGSPTDLAAVSGATIGPHAGLLTATQIVYNVGDYVQYNSLGWVCILQHTSTGASSDPPTDTTHWIGAKQAGNLISVGTTATTYAAFQALTDFTFDRLFIHPQEVTPSDLYPAPVTTYAANGIAANGQNIIMKDSWVGGFSGHFPQTTGVGAQFDVVTNLTVTNNELGGLFNNLGVGFSSTENPSHQTTCTSCTAATYTAGSGSGTLAVTTDLQVGDYVAFQVNTLTINDLASTAGTSVVTSATGGFSSDMVGAKFCILPSGNWKTTGTLCRSQVGSGAGIIYSVTVFTNTNTMTLNSDPTNGSNASAGQAGVGCNRDGQPCYASAAIDTLNAGTGAITYHAIGPSPNQYGYTGALLSGIKSGGTVQWRGLNANSVTVQRNRLFKPFSWQAAYPGAVKLYIQTKTCNSCTFNGNTMEGTSAEALALEAHDSTPGTRMPWSGYRTITYSNNLHLPNVGIVEAPMVAGTEVTTQTTAIVFTNNLWVSVAVLTPRLQAGTPCDIQCVSKANILAVSGGDDVKVTHNTAVGRGAQTVTAQVSCTDTRAAQGNYPYGGTTNVVLKDNISDNGTVETFGSDSCTGAGLLAQQQNAWGNGLVTTGGNLVPDQDEGCCGTQFEDPCQAGLLTCTGTKPDNVVAGWTSGATFVKLLDYTVCSGRTDTRWERPTPPPSTLYTGDYTKCVLDATSAWKGTATDNTDPGVDMTALINALGGVQAHVRPVAAERPPVSSRPTSPNRSPVQSRPSDGYN